MKYTLQSSIKDRILAAQKEAVDESTGLQKGLDEMIKQRSDGTLYYLDRIWVPLKGYVNARGIRDSFRREYGLSPSDRNGQKVSALFTLLEDNARASQRLWTLGEVGICIFRC
ncbi:hypothetical protein Tco_0475495 [Tanacetum coccineum]